MRKDDFGHLVVYGCAPEKYVHMSCSNTFYWARLTRLLCVFPGYKLGKTLDLDSRESCYGQNLRHISYFNLLNFADFSPSVLYPPMQSIHFESVVIATALTNS